MSCFPCIAFHKADKTGKPEGKDLAPEQPKTFSNWAENIQTPNVTHLYPDRNLEYGKPVKQVQEFIKTIRQQEKNGRKVGKVRVAQYHHSWTNFFCEEGDNIIAFRRIEQAERETWSEAVRDYDQIPTEPYHDFWGVSLIGIPYTLKHDHDGKSFKHHLVKVGSAASGNDIRNFSNDLVKVAKLNREIDAWSLPLNVVLLQNSVGGMVNMMCHGSGVNFGSHADLVVAIEFINTKGDIQRIGDPEIIGKAGLLNTWNRNKDILDRNILKKVVGNFGLMGIAVNYYLQLNKMEFARYQPKVMDGTTAISRNTSDLSSFAREVVSSYYNEYFFFPGYVKEDEVKQSLVNNWKIGGNPEESDLLFPDFHSNTKQLSAQQLLHQTGGLIKDIADIFLPDLIPIRRTINKQLGELALGHFTTLDAPVTIPVSDALHPLRGVNLARVFNLEVHIPIPVRQPYEGGDKAEHLIEYADWSIVSKAWWNAHAITNKNKYHMIPSILEFRILSGSQALMSPYYGNDLTLAIEILTFRDLVQEEDDKEGNGALVRRWKELMQDVLDEWMSIKDSNGNNLKVRPHWAKQWHDLGLQVPTDRYHRPSSQLYGRVPIEEYVFDLYREQTIEFTAALTQVANRGGYTFDDMINRFSNNLINNIIKSSS